MTAPISKVSSNTAPAFVIECEANSASTETPEKNPSTYSCAPLKYAASPKGKSLMGYIWTQSEPTVWVQTRMVNDQPRLVLFLDKKGQARIPSDKELEKQGWDCLKTNRQK